MQKREFVLDSALAFQVHCLSLQKRYSGGCEIVKQNSFFLKEIYLDRCKGREREEYAFKREQGLENASTQENVFKKEHGLELRLP